MLERKTPDKETKPEICFSSNSAPAQNQRTVKQKREVKEKAHARPALRNPVEQGWRYVTEHVPYLLLMNALPSAL